MSKRVRGILPGRQRPKAGYSTPETVVLQMSGHCALKGRICGPEKLQPSRSSSKAKGSMGEFVICEFEECVKCGSGRVERPSCERKKVLGSSSVRARSQAGVVGGAV
ncbi:unnamed protein product [Eretmochelys imbricata]